MQPHNKVMHTYEGETRESLKRNESTSKQQEMEEGYDSLKFLNEKTLIKLQIKKVRNEKQFL